MQNYKTLASLLIIWHIYNSMNSCGQKVAGDLVPAGAPSVGIVISQHNSINENSTTEYTTEEPPATENIKPPSILASASKLRPFKVGIGLAVYLTPVLCMVGLIGNTLAMIVTFQKQNRQISCYFYMGMLAITDSIALALSLGYWAFKDIYGQVLDVWKHRLICSTVFPVLASAILCGTYLILAMTVDRLIAVKWPLKAMSWCSTKRAKISSCLVIFSCTLAKLPYIWVVAPVPPNYACFAFQVEQTPIVVIYYWFNTAVGCYIPFALLLTLNCMIIHSIRRRHSYFEKKSASDGLSTDGTTQTVSIDSNALSDKAESLPNVSSTKKEASVKDAPGKKGQGDSSLTRMLLMVSFSFICLTGPIYAFYVVYIFKNNMASPEALAEYVMVGNICNQMLLTNYAINFYLYCLGGTKFRSDLKKTLSELFASK